MKKIFITGGTGEFGSLISQLLVKKGNKVVATLHNENSKINKSSKKKLEELGVTVVYMDITDDDSVKNAVSQSIKLLGGLDVVINNAGILSYGVQELASVKDMESVFDVNVFGVQRVMREVLPYLRNQGHGTIIYTSSLIGRISFPFYGTYSASKFALEGLAEAYRSELSRFGIDSCIVEPGAMNTQFFNKAIMSVDSTKESDYNMLITVSNQAKEGLLGGIDATPDQRPIKVAQAFIDLIEMPRGKRPFRTTVDFIGAGQNIDLVNEKINEITQTLYSNFGMSQMLQVVLKEDEK